ncbi:MAG: serine/threonine protein kinase [Labilithrix sp.]|nr:serine/threonine protein kinase [Labilithrix sp.]MCW5814624.1 serine/threonine protein kinase [Labilithrix sp.]
MTAIMRPAKTCPRCRGRYESDALFCPKDGAPLDDPHPATEETPPTDRYLGTVIAGDIAIQSIAGMGAMGRVYRAHQRGIDRDVAVKILHRELSSNTQLVSRFNREAKIASKLQHPHVVEVYLAGQLDDGSLYTVMEFLDGVSLASALREAGSVFTIERALAITLQICDAVGEAHARGIVHRDLKPENVMLVHRAEVAEWVKVLDFGIAKLTLGEQSMETAAGLIFGTARYISPEGAQGRPVGPPGDVYAITTMLFEMLAGRTPFEAEPLGLLIKHIHEPAPELHTINAAGAAVPVALSRAIGEQLCKEPENRAQNGRALAAALVAAARDANISLSDVGAIARMSHLPDPAGSSKRVALAPTVDDFGLVPTPRASSDHGARSAPPPARVSGAVETARASEPRISEPSEPAATPPASRWPSALMLVFVFALGSAITALLIHRLMLHPAEERRLYHERVRLALAEGHYVTPPGENVRELVDDGMKRWPTDGTLRQMKSAAAKEMVTMAFAARESGDLVGARNIASLALELEPTDNSARYMRAQCEEELVDAQNGTSARVGPPRLIFESPHLVKPGVLVQITAKIIYGAADPKTTPVTDMKLSIHATGKTTGGPLVTFASQDPSAIRATFHAPSVTGTYDVSFEADVGGTTVRAMRRLAVNERE